MDPTVQPKGGEVFSALASGLSHFQAVLLTLWCLVEQKKDSSHSSFVFCFHPLSVQHLCVITVMLTESWSSPQRAEPLAWLKAGNLFFKKGTEAERGMCYLGK